MWVFNDAMGVWQAQVNEPRGSITSNDGAYKKVVAFHVTMFLIYSVVLLYLYLT